MDDSDSVAEDMTVSDTDHPTSDRQSIWGVDGDDGGGNETPYDPYNGDESVVADPNHDLARIDGEDRNHVTMSVTVDVSEHTEREIEAFTELARLYENAFQEVVAKNRDYGFSFLRTGLKLSQTPAYDSGDATRSQIDGLLHRTGDKRERIIENVFGDGDARVSDSPATTAQECANYYVFMALVLSNPDLAVALSDCKRDSRGEA